mmetsp:Transcript_44842/g.95443  ORF Transcript_44842/g.95443 Transcript_44842/m.95443 type:complete len:530 (-) Transcript_44842:89-1678(-)|eukprot:CAMPEP_0172530046 /NCGR_PEP_ID=MMETSP1067-20121228/3917_1 /TAXON_ID=265564 ORGANISM="Thalassiosira punctigera, Strain Tpunct2005C2" /NCGR_SAMPLE_ID=MMETSP1067 /ASSEMBLY_ACC=CAM_ASM_000444 /LENGTH=529 /DNA_ID=CAMNT_0013314189 /DNA_START=137 /DNA_END=1726 /DNA_ORIENTATION=-
MKASPRKLSLTIAALLVAIGSPVELQFVGAEASAAQKTMCAMGFATCAPEVQHDPPFASSTATTTTSDPNAGRVDESNGVDPNEEYIANCHIWPPSGAPPEHRDTACNRAMQNAAWAADDVEANAAPPDDLIPDTVYLNLPEEKTWVCPLDTVPETMGGNVNNLMNPAGVAGATGHPTRWILHNEATSPIVLAHVNPLGLEVSANDFRTHPAHADTAVYPHGPIVLPGQMAVVEGRQGQMFVAREYREVLPMHAMAGEDDGDDVQHSWKSFKSVLPPTLSFLPERTRYTTKGGVQHVLGRAGRVLMKHRMGNIYVRNQFGAICPELMGAKDEGGDTDDGRRGTPKDMDPDCNVLRKAFINRVGCPVDIYFAPQNRVEGYNCEKFTKHLGSMEPFLSSDVRTRDIDDFGSPLKFENTYNGHLFVARMSHDQSLVASIEVDHDVVRDCPEPQRSAAGIEVWETERVLQGMPVVKESANVTKSEYASNDWVVSVQINRTKSTVIPGKIPKEKHNVHWHNHAGMISASLHIVS